MGTFQNPFIYINSLEFEKVTKKNKVFYIFFA